MATSCFPKISQVLLFMRYNYLCCNTGNGRHSVQCYLEQIMATESIHIFDETYSFRCCSKKKNLEHWHPVWVLKQLEMVSMLTCLWMHIIWIWGLQSRLESLSVQFVCLNNFFFFQQACGSHTFAHRCTTGVKWNANIGERGQSITEVIVRAVGQSSSLTGAHIQLYRNVQRCSPYTAKFPLLFSSFEIQ